LQTGLIIKDFAAKFSQMKSFVFEKPETYDWEFFSLFGKRLLNNPSF